MEIGFLWRLALALTSYPLWQAGAILIVAAFEKGPDALMRDYVTELTFINRYYVLAAGIAIIIAAAAIIYPFLHYTGYLK